MWCVSKWWNWWRTGWQPWAECLLWYGVDCPCCPAGSVSRFWCITTGPVPGPGAADVPPPVPNAPGLLP